MVRPYQKKERNMDGGEKLNWKSNNYQKSDIDFCTLSLEKQEAAVGN